MSSEPILFFDGVCGLCNHSVNFLLKIDTNNRLLFAPLQGETAKNLLKYKYINDLDTLVLYHKGEIHIKSTASLEILKLIGGFWKLFYIFIIIPSSIRDPFYSFIAKRRYKLFGKNLRCRIPTEKDKNKILI